MVSEQRAQRYERLLRQGREIKLAEAHDPDLGPLMLLPGVWRSEGRGWNMIALPFATQPPPDGFNFRVLMHQYSEELEFTLVDKAVPNRGIRRNGATVDTDQLVVTLDYEQEIDQVKGEDFPVSGKEGDPGTAIHHEPGLWLHMTNEITNGIDIARLATIPHGDSALALGRSAVVDGPPQIGTLNGLPIGAIGVGQDFQNNRYLTPYKHFIDNPFFGTVPPSLPGFPGFHPLDLNAILNFANNGVDIVRTTVLEVDTTLEDAGIVNIPFIVKQANATSMKSTFWIEELAEQDEQGQPKLRLQYSQVVILDFFERRDGLPGLISWPHVSINTLDRVGDIGEEQEREEPRQFGRGLRDRRRAGRRPN
jgi:hypothetical protein